MAGFRITSATAGSRPSRALTRWVLLGGLLVGTLASSSIGWGGHNLPDGLRGATKAVEIAVGWSFIGVGVVAWRRRPDSRSGILMVILGFAWLVRLVGAIVHPVASALGTVLGPVYLAVLTHLLVTFPSGRLTSRPQRWPVAAAYLCAAPLAALVLLVGDVDPAVSAPPGLLLGIDTAATHVDPGVAEKAANAAMVACLLAAAALITTRWLHAGAAQRRSTAPTVWGGVAVTLTIAVDHFAVLAPLPATAGAVLAWSARVVLLWLPVALLIGILRSRLDETAVAAMILELGRGMPMPDRLQSVIARTLHDPTARLYYWLPGRNRFVDASGNAHDASPDRPGRAWTYLERNGSRIAVLEHDAVLAGERQLVSGVLAGIGLAVENERLQVEVRAQLREVVASRARIVEAVDESRRRVERDLHNGAYRRLETVAAALAHFEAGLPSTPAAAQLTGLDRISGELSTALDELRTLARGIYPVLLSDAGLGPAVSALIERSPTPATLVTAPAGRFPEPLEQAGYFVILHALDAAAGNVAVDRVAVAVTFERDVLVVEITSYDGGGTDPAAVLRESADRLAALDGTLVVDRVQGPALRLRAELPVPVSDTGTTLDMGRVVPLQQPG